MSILKVKDKDGKFVDVPVISGRPASIRVGEVKLLEPNSEPTIENVGTEYDAIFDFGIPKGEYIVQGEDFRLDLSDYAKQKQLDKEILNRQQTDNSLQSQIKSLASGSPKGVYTDVTALKTANPDTGVYITSDNGHIYSWIKNSEEPIDLGVYQSAMCDDGLSLSSTNAVQNKVVTSSIEDLYSRIGLENIEMTGGYNINLNGLTGDTVTLIPEAVSGWYYAIVDCQEGDVFIVNGSGGSNPRLWGFIDSDNKIVSNAIESAKGTNLVLYAPRNAVKFIVNNKVKGKRSYKGSLKTDEINRYIAKLETGLIDYTGLLISPNSGIPTNVNIGETVDLTTIEHSNNYKYMILDCVEGDRFKIIGSAGNNLRLYAFVDSNNKLLIKSPVIGSYRTTEFKAPKNTSKVIINIYTQTGEYHVYKYIDSNINSMKNDVTELQNKCLSLKDGYGKNYAYFSDEGNIGVGNITIGSVVDLTTVELSEGYKYVVLDCEEADEFKITGAGGSNPRLWAFLDENNTLLSRAEARITGTYNIVAPRNAAKLLVNCNTYSSEFILYKYDELNLEKLNEKITSYNYTSDVLTGNIKNGVAVGETVNLTPEAINYYRYVVLDCEENERFIVNGSGGSNPRLWGFIDSDNKLLSVANSKAKGKHIIKAPTNASKLIVNLNVDENQNGISLEKCYVYKCDEKPLVNKMRLDNLEDNLTMLSQDEVKELPEDTICSFIKGINFGDELKNPITDFKKTGDLMVHVSTFCIINDIVYVTYYANTRTNKETPSEHTARFAYCSLNDLNNKTFVDLQDVGEKFDGKTVSEIYDTILLQKDDNTLYLMWTAALNGVYYRLYRTYTISTGVMSDIMINNFKVGNVTNQFSTTGMNDAFESNNITHKSLVGDIGIMQKLTSRVENGTTYYYTGAYVGPFNCIIKSSDLITWEFVAQPDFENNSQWENAVYVLNDKAFYFCRQYADSNTGFLTYYDLNTGKWANPVMVNDCQSRSDFFEYNGSLYLVHAPKNRNYISIMFIDKTYLNRSYELQTAKLPDYFYPFVQVYNNELYMSFTQSRQHIYLSKFTLNNPSTDDIRRKFKELFYE